MNTPEGMPVPHPTPKRHRSSALKARQRLGKFRVVRKISQGGFAEVFEAEDTIEGIRVALRVPRPDIVDDHLLEDFRKEVRLLARLEHAHILPVKNADVIDGLFVIATLLGEETLADALERRMPVRTLLEYGEQLLLAVAHAHERGVIHCDIKPDNLILFRGGRLRLTDFGIAKVVLGTVEASGSGTIGYLAPEQALGRPTARSDVFAVGLVFWQMLAGVVPEWPFEWPLPGVERAAGVGEAAAGGRASSVSSGAACIVLACALACLCTGASTADAPSSPDTSRSVAGRCGMRCVDRPPLSAAVAAAGRRAVIE